MQRKSAEFDTEIEKDGTIRLPVSIVDQMDLRPGTKLQVRVSSTALSSALREREVTEEEIERIAGIQLEPREQVIKFLLSEGAATGNAPFQKRLMKHGKAH